MAQNADVAGRDFTTDNRRGIAGAVTYRPTENVTIKADYSFTHLYGLPDFGVPYNQVERRPVTENDVPRDTYYGIVNRDFTRTNQGLGHARRRVARQRLAQAREPVPSESFAARLHRNHSGESRARTARRVRIRRPPTFFSGYTQLNAQSRYEPVGVQVDQPQATFKFDAGPVRNTAIIRGEFSRERISIDTYSGFTSELTTGPVAFTSSGAPIVSVFDPTHYSLRSGNGEADRQSAQVRREHAGRLPDGYRELR